MLYFKKTLTASIAVFAMGASGSALAAYGLPEGPAVAPATTPVIVAETPGLLGQQNWYVGALGGVDFISKFKTVNVKSGDAFSQRLKPKTGWLAGTHLGYRDGQMRYELEYLYQAADLKKKEGKDVAVHAGLVNAVYDIAEPGSSFVPYLKAGLGYGSVHVKAFSNNPADVKGTRKVSQGRFVYQVGAGVGFNASDNVTLSVGYNYLGSTKVKKDFLRDGLRNHNVYVSADWNV